jgi:5'-nucleotidase / UDP-sugar diphosphatase
MSFSSFRRGAVIASVATALTASGALTTAASAGGSGHGHDKRDSSRPDFTLTVLHVNDLESSLLPISDAEGDYSYGGVDRFVQLLQEERENATRGHRDRGMARDRGVVAVSGGDNFLPGPQLDASDALPGPIFDAIAFRDMDLDVSIFGNHDFDRTPEFLGQYLEDLEDRHGRSVPFLTNNLDVSAEPALLAQVEDGTIVSSHVEEIEGEKIGFIGLTTPELPRLTSSEDVVVDPALAEIANRQAAYYAEHGVDKVILISHLQDIDNELALAAELSGVDLIVGAGGGELLASEGDRLRPGTDPAVDVAGEYPLLPTDADGDVVPVVTTPGLYEYVGKLVVTFDKKGELLTVHDRLSRPIPVVASGPDGVRPDRSVNREVVQPVQEFVTSLQETVVADTAVPLSGVRDEVRSQETNLGNLVADSLLDAGQDGAAAAGVIPPVVALQNGGGIRNDAVIPTGDLTAFDTYSVLPFANFVGVAPAVPIATFVAAVEHGLGGPVEGDVLQPAGSFAQAAGYTVTYDASLPAGSRIRTLTLDDGTVIVDGGALAGTAPTTISVATIDFLLRGGDGYPFDGVEFTVLPTTYQEALENYLIDDLAGVVSAAEYPVGGEGRIVEVD